MTTSSTCVGDMLDLDSTRSARRCRRWSSTRAASTSPTLRTWWERLPEGSSPRCRATTYGYCPDHVNCVENVGELKRQLPMSEVLYEGTRHLTDEGLLGRPDLVRFMVIGRR